MFFKSNCPIWTIELSFRPFLSQVKPLIIPEVDIIRVHTPKQDNLNKYLKKSPEKVTVINNDISKLLILIIHMGRPGISGFFDLYQGRS